MVWSLAGLVRYLRRSCAAPRSLESELLHVAYMYALNSLSVQTPSTVIYLGSRNLSSSTANATCP